jgi:hypothetical protein
MQPTNRDLLKSSALAGLLLIGCISLTGCGLWPRWHWEKPGASSEELDWDQTQCKAKTYAGNMGEVTNETVRRMHACMEGKGWKKRNN